MINWEVREDGACMGNVGNVRFYIGKRNAFSRQLVLFLWRVGNYPATTHYEVYSYEHGKQLAQTLVDTGDA